MRFFSTATYLRGLQCHKALWLRAREAPAARPGGIMDGQGALVARLARQLFPGGAAVAGETRAERIEHTRRLMADGARVLYGAVIAHGGMAAETDILRGGADGGWDLFEVKSASAIKEVYKDGVALQYFVLTQAGMRVDAAWLAHINSHYVRRGELQPGCLFTLVEVTADARRRQENLEREFAAMSACLQAPVPPEAEIGEHCFQPVECDAMPRCWAHVPEHSVFTIGRLDRAKKFALYRSGIVDLRDLPADYALTAAQRKQVEASLSGEIMVDKTAIRHFLERLRYPLCFLDFESFQQAIPPYDDLRPYEQTPFQYSLHSLAAPDAEVAHREFLAAEDRDPRPEIAARLIEDAAGAASILAYNAGFEKSVIRALARRFPQWRKDLQAIHNRVDDLMTPFQKRFIYQREMKGRSSIKAVAPALLPELSYERLAIHDGREAMRAYHRLAALADAAEKEKIRRDLLEYCRLDTLSMVKLLERLRALSAPE